MILRNARFVLAVALVVFLLPALAFAVTPPTWVAAIHIAAQNAIGLRWNPVPGATGYKVLRSATSGAGYVEIGSGAVPQFIDTKLEQGETYYYVLQAVAGAEVSPNSPEKTVIVPGEKKVALVAPTWKNVTLAESKEFGKTSFKVGLFWNTPAGAIAYNVYRSLTPGKDYQMVNSTSELQYIDTAIEEGKTYYYTVSALDQSFQESPYAPEKPVEIKASEKKAEAKVEKKAKVKLALRRCKLVREIKTDQWGSLQQPFGIDRSSRDEIFVSDYYGENVVVFNKDGDFLFSFKEGVSGPMDLAIDENDQVYVVMDRGNKVGIFNDKGVLKTTLIMKELVPDAPKTPSAAGISFGPDNWFLSDNSNGVIYLMEYGKNKVIKTWGSQGDGPNQFMAPNKTFYFPKVKKLVVADTFNFRVKVISDFTGDGTPSLIFGDYGNSVGQFSRLSDVGPDDQGNIMTLDAGSQTSQVFDMEGNFKYVLGSEDGTEQIPMGGPTAFTVLGKRAYIVNNMSGILYIWELLDEIGPPVKKP